MMESSNFMMMSRYGNAVCITDLWEGIHRSPVDYPHKRLVIRTSDSSIDVSLHKILKKNSKSRWQLET